MSEALTNVLGLARTMSDYQTQTSVCNELDIVTEERLVHLERPIEGFKVL